MKHLFYLLCVAVSLSLTACDNGGGEEAGAVSDDQAAQLASTAELKQTLQDIANSGDGGSALMGLRPSIESMESADPEKAKLLLAELDELESAESPEDIKRIAEQMAGKL
jgi:hypothetical protein